MKKKYKADLHIHTNYSFDSTNSVENVLMEARKANIDVIAIADHNQMGGSLKAQTSMYPEVLPCIEIDCFCDEDILHLLGYGVDLTNPKYEKIKTHYEDELNRIAYERLRVIEERYNCHLDREKIKSLSHFDGFSNVEIERVLLEDVQDPELEPYQTGDKKDNPIANYYWDNLSIGKWGYVALDLPQYEDIFQLIHETGGVVICAHPTVNIQHRQDVIDKLIKKGIDGFEVYCSYHSPSDSSFYLEVVEKNHLLMTCGSDYHGITKPNIQIGQTNYDEDCEKIVTALKDRINTQRRRNQ